MANTYKLINHTDPLPADEIRRLYMSYWVYIVKAVKNTRTFEPRVQSSGILCCAKSL